MDATTASILKRRPSGNGMVMNASRLTTMSPPFSTKMLRASRLVIAMNASTCMSFVLNPSVKAMTMASRIAITTETSPMVEKAWSSEKSSSPIGRKSEKWFGKKPSFVEDRRMLLVGLLWWLKKTGAPIQLHDDVHETLAAAE